MERTATRSATRSESLLRPREIQVRIRAGQTPETVAAAAQTSVDRVMVFATPVLAERAFVAQQAGKASVRRRVGDGPVGLLGDAVARRLESAGLDPETAEWDAWRREDGRWTVVTSWRESGDELRAEFTYDAMGRYVVAEDDPARWLVGERRAPEPVRAPELPHQLTDAADRLGGAEADHSADDSADDELLGQLALGDDALEVVTGRPLSAVRSPAPVAREVPAAPEVARADYEPTEDLTETVRAVREVGAVRPVGIPEPAVAADHSADPDPGEGDGLFADSDLRAGAAGTARRTARTTSGARPRRSMPSWDDIMLGSAPRGD